MNFLRDFIKYVKYKQDNFSIRETCTKNSTELEPDHTTCTIALDDSLNIFKDLLARVVKCWGTLTQRCPSGSWTSTCLRS